MIWPRMDTWKIQKWLLVWRVLHVCVFVLHHPCLYFQTEQVSLLIVLFTLIGVGNSTVLAVLFLSGKIKSRMNLFMANLACAGGCKSIDFNIKEISWSDSINNYWFDYTYDINNHSGLCYTTIVSSFFFFLI